MGNNEKSLEEVKDLKSLFKIWKEAQDQEIDELEEKLKDPKRSEGDVFEHDLYQKRGKNNQNTISSHFIQFFYKKYSEDCGEIREKKPWKYVLKNAFHMDGGIGTFDVGNGFEYIFLLKEANDSGKTCVEQYPEFELNPQNVNVWLKEWLEQENHAKMLKRINDAFKEYLGVEEENFSFTSAAAYMNVNKRGGTQTTAGYDESAVIRYAKHYKEYILKEIQLLANQREKVTVFVCGGEHYFTKLMQALDIKENESKKYEIQSNKTKIVFLNIYHPSGPISVEKLADVMRRI